MSQKIKTATQEAVLAFYAMLIICATINGFNMVFFTSWRTVLLEIFFIVLIVPINRYIYKE